MRYGLCFLLLLASLSFRAQDVDTLRVYSFAEAEALQVQEPRPYLVFIHADWCKYCRGMERNTFSDPAVVELLNERYYFVELDGEDPSSIEFAGREFVYVPSGTTTGVHELAEALGSINGKLAYPTTVVLGANNEIDFQYNAFLSAEQLLSVLRGPVLGDR